MFEGINVDGDLGLDGMSGYGIDDYAEENEIDLSDLDSSASDSDESLNYDDYIASCMKW